MYISLAHCGFIIRSPRSTTGIALIQKSRKKGGTPAILGSIRAGLAVQLKEAVGTEWIMAHEEEELCRRVFRE
jgi:selenocysteine lyase/cysteine desulfurase